MWRQKAEALFFMERLSVTDIAHMVGKRRETVSRYISKCVGYEAEKERRMYERGERRREYKAVWMKEKRDLEMRMGNNYECGMITAETLQNEHVAAVKILSAERFSEESYV